MSRFSEELGILRNIIIRFTGIFFIFFFGFLILAPTEITLAGFRIFVLAPGTPSLATSTFLALKEALVPEGVSIIAVDPVSSFAAPIIVAFLVTILGTFPFGLYLIIQFLRPALHLNEQKILSAFILPSIFLFYAGCSLAYFVIIPQTFSILYSFSGPIGVEPFFALGDFISSVFFLTISVGFAFLLPVFMTAASRIGLIPEKFWIRHFRGAIISMLIFSAIITPDGSGVTMALLSVPLLGLYLLGTLVTSSKHKDHQ